METQPIASLLNRLGIATGVILTILLIGLCFYAYRQLQEARKTSLEIQLYKKQLTAEATTE